MVFVNDKKFACESCIKGHRSSSCSHADRPLFEVKKKGRPVSQCQQCRELRKIKKVHSRCECHNKPIDKPQVRQLTANSKRFIPILPALPNGLKDALTDQSTRSPPNPLAKVGTLLNPCNCKDIWSCKCRSLDRSNIVATTSNGGLDALANAAALCCSQEAGAAAAPTVAEEMIIIEKQTSSCCQSNPKSTKNPKRKRRGSPSPTPSSSSKLRGPSLAPIFAPISPLSSSSGPSSTAAVPEFPTIPPLSSVVALAGSGCSCGFRCTCPGCVEHRGPQHASKDHGDCPDGCGTCVDHESGLELPAVHSHHCTPGPARSSHAPSGFSGTSFVDAFFARVAGVTLPPAPPQRARRATLDPTDITVYPSMLFANEKHLEERGPAFGLVSVPKLQCCSGKCGCPDGSCGCGKSCGGCADEAERISGNKQPSTSESSSKSSAIHHSCCSTSPTN